MRGVRDEFSYEEQPSEEQADWVKFRLPEPLDYFLYCPSCEKWSAIGMTEEL
jgi:hypothetical protein